MIQLAEWIHSLAGRDAIELLRTTDPWALVAALLLIQVLVEMHRGRMAIDHQLADAGLAGYDVAARQVQESRAIAEEQAILEEERQRTQVAIAVGRRATYLLDLPPFVRERARDKRIAWELMPVYRLWQERA